MDKVEMDNFKAIKIKDLVEFEKIIIGNNGLDLSEIGLLTFLLLRKDANLLKCEIGETFGRRKFERAWKGLHDKEYMISILVQGSEYRYYLYYVNGTPFTKEEVENIVKEASKTHKIKKVIASENLGISNKK